MKVTGLAQRDESGRLRRAVSLGRANCFQCKVCCADSVYVQWTNKVKHLSEEQKEAIKGCTSASDIDVQDMARGKYQPTLQCVC